MHLGKVPSSMWVLQAAEVSKCLYVSKRDESKDANVDDDAILVVPFEDVALL
ncbi:hypothetical protein EXN66_Car007024 [Channa argus]|uniref:Uncharacterized protein n=1 Tax=Channa argus TaxID=215402 RepID=A0A6G1PM99_CHAAH|nr:hypothetical protein EXN66_Car007024 [Channa argus]